MTNISSENVWYQVKYQQKENEIPCPRSGHTAVFFRNSLLFVFGGLTDQDALNDMHVYNLHTNVINLIRTIGITVPIALDLVICRL